MDELQKAFYEVSGKVYNQGAPQGGPDMSGFAQGGFPGGQPGGDSAGSGDDDVIDTDFTEE